MRFKINIGNYTEYMADASLEMPSNDRQLLGWVETTAGVPTAIGVIACTSSSVPNDYSLQIDTTVAGTDSAYFAHSAGTAPFHGLANNQQGYTIESQLKVVDAGSTKGQTIDFRDNIYQEELRFYTTRIELGTDGSTYPMTTTDEFHTYTITVKGTTIKVYVNSALRITGTLSATSGGATNREVSFGDRSAVANNGGESRYAYFKYRTDGAYSPCAAIDDDWVFDKFDIQEKRRSGQYSIIRSDNTIIPENKMNAPKIKVSGTVVGSDWGSFRDTVRRLKRMLNDGTQKIYIDNARYINGLHDSFTLTPVTPDFAKFKTSFNCEYPFWSEKWASYFSTAPVHAATFYITNNSDTEVPCKIIFTGPVGTGTETDFYLYNKTLNQEGKYTGTLVAAQELIVDKGFDSFNDYAVKIGTGSAFSSYEGDLFTLTPGVNAFMYSTGTGQVLGTIEVYWREAYLL